MSCNDDYKAYIGWYFISSCTCGETAVDAVKNVLNKKIPNHKEADFTVGLYPFVFYRSTGLDRHNCDDITCDDERNKEPTNVGCCSACFLFFSFWNFLFV